MMRVVGKQQLAEELGYNVKYLFRVINHNCELMLQLLAVGYQVRQRTLTAKQAKIIRDYYE